MNKPAIPAAVYINWYIHSLESLPDEKKDGLFRKL
jgi:hypothetical protein